MAAGRYNQHILNLAILTLEAASGAESGNAYRVTQDIRNAEVRTDCTMAGRAVQTRAFLSPSSSTLVVELSTNSGEEVPLQATLSVIGNQHVARSAGHVGPVAWVTKEPNPEGAPFFVKGAVAARVLGAAATPASDNNAYSRLAFALPASGATVTLVVQAEHTKNAGSPLASVQAAVREMDDAGIARIAAENKAWWKAFWLRSYIRLGDDVQNYWYNHPVPRNHRGEQGTWARRRTPGPLAGYSRSDERVSAPGMGKHRHVQAGFGS
ncbi:MAG TPA: hypothetical protein PKM43_13145 [Verrucomicrobiota bacterium]|nr:hypothetical protein [Verrucomicrobiota bacterium]HRZ38413.1 hypothetical protein [Candidatus Paceibacterota bacterium]HRZ56557.1 hypothetical protein [Candidatus Paceibacterota bacterium]